MAPLRRVRSISIGPDAAFRDEAPEGDGGGYHVGDKAEDINGPVRRRLIDQDMARPADPAGRIPHPIATVPDVVEQRGPVDLVAPLTRGVHAKSDEMEMPVCC